MEFSQIIALAPYVTTVVVAAVAGWVINTHNRIRNGYPLENSWGMAIHPKTDREAEERIKLLTSENAELRAQMSAMKERVETVERIVTDQSYGLAQEIDQLSIEKKARN
ncbi:hypothetical protein [Sphingomicrobium astaxanthinifaciens]|uniref:hypothetical protein n=1 Tax=Sphingomicrobium astaxanthinifaciens TaxID=1227949 RepID=UPI001FCC0078|nr:hypothetical protein [Sphingomicrobium astaxanthinifaciens]MCJ7422260.1 hypothetical protein [Sphingomicrobium astaxanthinifaciens]